MVGWTSRASEETRVQVKCGAERVSPEKVAVRVDSAASGILFKEFYFKDWHAFLEKDERKIRELKICRAGPDFMYIAIPRDSEYPITVVFEFGRTIEYTGLSVSATTLSLLLTYGLAGERLIARSLLLSARSGKKQGAPYARSGFEGLNVTMVGLGITSICALLYIIWTRGKKAMILAPTHFLAPTH